MAVAGTVTSGGAGVATIVLGVLTTTTTIGDGITTTITTTIIHTTTTLCVHITHVSRRSTTAHAVAHAMRDATQACHHAVARALQAEEALAVVARPLIAHLPTDRPMAMLPLVRRAQ